MLQLWIDVAKTVEPSGPTRRVDAAEAVRLWEESRWASFGRIVWMLLQPLQPAAYYGARIKLPINPSEETWNILLLRAAVEFLAQGRRLTVIADDDLWCSLFCLPLTGADRVFHFNLAAKDL